MEQAEQESGSGGPLDMWPMGPFTLNSPLWFMRIMGHAGYGSCGSRVMGRVGHGSFE